MAYKPKNIICAAIAILLISACSLYAINKKDRDGEADLAASIKNVTENITENNETLEESGGDLTQNNEANMEGDEALTQDDEAHAENDEALTQNNEALAENEKAYLKNDKISAEDLRAEIDIYNEISGETSNDSLVIGKEIEPLETLEAMLRDYVIDCQAENKWMEYLHNTGYAGEDTPLTGYLALIGSTKDFSLYSADVYGNMLISFRNESYIWINDSITSNYGVQPKISQSDYDNDNEAELVIWLENGIHGTGLYEEVLYVIDRTKEGNWMGYQCPLEWVSDLTSKHYSSEIEDDVMYLKIDGKRVGTPYDTQGDGTFEFAGGDQIRYVADDNIYLYSQLAACSDNLPFGNYESHNGIRYRLDYLGDGRWDIKGYEYYDAADFEKLRLSSFSG